MNQLATPRGLRSRRSVVALTALTVLVLVGGVLATLGASSGSGGANRFVTRSGTSLRLDGEAFRFVGFNLYDAAASDIYSCSPSTRLDDAGLDDAMESIEAVGGTVVRFWAYQTYTSGGTDFSGVDRVIRAARRHHLRVMPVLEDGPGDCSTGDPGVQLDRSGSGSWYSRGYRSPLGTATISYRDYVAIVARRYRDDPTIVAWSLMNEAETTERDERDRSVLVDFAEDVSAVVHAADPRHLVTLGSQSNGAPGASGADFSAIYGLPGMDLTEVHDWANWGSDTEAMPGAQADGRLPDPADCERTDEQIACSFVLARELDKPIVVGEAGISAESVDTRERRADLFTAKITAAFRAGASGYLIWQLNSTNTDSYAVEIKSRDPLNDVLLGASRRWSSPSGA